MQILSSLSGLQFSAASAGYAPTNSADVSAIASAYATGIGSSEASAIASAYAESAASGKLDSTAFSTVSGYFLTAHQSLAGYATEAYVDSSVSGKLDSTAFNSADFYSTANESGFVDSAYVDSAVSGKQDELTFAYDADSAISSINGSALAGGGGATGDYVEKSSMAVTIGNGNTATNTAFAQGLRNSASNGSFAQGSYCKATGGSFAQGYSAIADGGSLAQGFYVSAKNYATALGTYNLKGDGDISTGESAAFVIGDGYDEDARHDLMVVTKDGEITMFSSTDDTAGTGIMSSIRAISAAAGGGATVPVTGTAWDSATSAMVDRSANLSAIQTNGWDFRGNFSYASSFYDDSGNQYFLASRVLAPNTLQTANKNGVGIQQVYCPTQSMFSGNDLLGVLSQLQYATGAGMSLSSEAFRASYKADTIFLSRSVAAKITSANSALTTALKMEAHNTRGPGISGSARAQSFSIYNDGVSICKTGVSSDDSGNTARSSVSSLLTTTSLKFHSAGTNATMRQSSIPYWNAKLDSSSIECDENSAITAIAGSSIGGGVDSATVSAIASSYAESAASSKADSSSLSSYALSGDVSGVIDTVSNNSASWAGGGGDYVEKSALNITIGTGNALKAFAVGAAIGISATGSNRGYAFGTGIVANNNVIAVGQTCRAEYNSQAFGQNVSAYDECMAAGYNISAKSRVTAFGRFNLNGNGNTSTGNSAAFVIGDGTAINKRHDLMVVTKDGEITMFSSTADTTGTGILSSIRAISAAAGGGGVDSATVSAIASSYAESAASGKLDISAMSAYDDVTVLYDANGAPANAGPWGLLEDRSNFKWLDIAYGTDRAGNEVQSTRFKADSNFMKISINRYDEDPNWKVAMMTLAFTGTSMGIKDNSIARYTVTTTGSINVSTASAQAPYIYQVIGVGRTASN